jgi:hypothetical protein
MPDNIVSCLWDWESDDGKHTPPEVMDVVVISNDLDISSLMEVDRKILKDRELVLVNTDGCDDWSYIAYKNYGSYKGKTFEYCTYGRF